MKTRTYTEWEVEVWSKEKAKKAGWYVRKFTSPAHRDVPDDLFAKGGRIFFIEFKAPGRPARPSQKHEHDLMRAAGLDVFVIDTREKFQALLDDEEFKLELS